MTPSKYAAYLPNASDSIKADAQRLKQQYTALETHEKIERAALRVSEQHLRDNIKLHHSQEEIGMAVLTAIANQP